VAGFTHRLADHGIRLPKTSIYRGPDQGVRRRVRRLLTASNPPDAIVTGSDAVGLPTEPTLTSARIPVERIARELVARCVRQVEHSHDDGPGFLLPVELVRGGSA